MKLTISILIKTDMSKKLIVELDNKLKDLESKRIKDKTLKIDAILQWPGIIRPWRDYHVHQYIITQEM